MAPDAPAPRPQPGAPAPPGPPDRPARRPRWSVDSGLVLGFILIGIGLAALVLKGFDRTVQPTIRGKFDELAWSYDPYFNGGFEPLNVNTASREELLLLPMVSEPIADGIIARRPFRLTEELLEVRGIEEANLGIISIYLYGFEDQPEPRPLKPPGIPDA